MKMLCISDHIDPLVYTNSIKERFKDVDIVLSAGDLPMDYLDFVVSNLNRPLLFIFGNHDENHFKKDDFKDITNPLVAVTPSPSAGAIHLGSRVRYEDGLIFAGLDGSKLYNKGDNQYTELQMRIEILKLLPGLLFNRIFRGRYIDILLTHAPPEGIHDKPDKCHQGFKCFLWFMRTFKPRYLVHGHIHLYDLSEVRTTKYHQTTVLNAYSHYLIDTKAEL